MSNVTNQQALAANAALPRPRRGSFVVRMALARVANVQDPRALHAAGRIVLAMPVIQIVLLVGAYRTRINSYARTVAFLACPAE